MPPVWQAASNLFLTFPIFIEQRIPVIKYQLRFLDFVLSIVIVYFIMCTQFTSSPLGNACNRSSIWFRHLIPTFPWIILLAALPGSRRTSIQQPAIALPPKTGIGRDLRRFCPPREEGVDCTASSPQSRSSETRHCSDTYYARISQTAIWGDHC